ncbi:MAG: hypothetical protein AAF614_42290, partial [Chloroflexota bacterium]
DQAVENAAEPDSYLFPYKQFTDNPFKGVLKDVQAFLGFSPKNANGLLQLGIGGLADKVVRTTVLPMDTELLEAGIVNIPFVERQADAAVMRATFWIMELDEVDKKGRPRLLLAYSQFIFLDFFERFDGEDGLIRWPHISINVMEKIAWPEEHDTSSSYRMGPKKS